MKKVLLLLLLIASSCNTHSSKGKFTKCVVTRVTKVYRYPGLFPDTYFWLETSCGYNLHSNIGFLVGDTVQVEVVEPKNF